MTGKANTLTYDENGHNEQGMAPCMLEMSSAREGIYNIKWAEGGDGYLERNMVPLYLMNILPLGANFLAAQSYCSQEQALWGYVGTFMDYPAARNAMKAHTIAECAAATGLLGGSAFTFVGAEK